MHNGCIVWGVPPQGRQAVLQELHEGHLGMTKMKALARMYGGLELLEILKIQCAPAPNVKPISHYPWLLLYILGAVQCAHEPDCTLTMQVHCMVT